ncbi:GNAT family N-acetyltransferase [Mesobacterium sp. TK19101]|uniref:GNAT family N-acetyltransferase n=1 Tax=Mesobacterium hydrothermale TaxID=3111907 RepID=A0ABU6HP79_9RHOB|nr:GNAT family N-acetyltransferase [Mesobacterium sp. TK19101]MEC3863045.1 GNAT family N-acetyltransferase [Mesobacterium sp. TK19101]
MPLTIRAPRTTADWDAARRLCWEYRDFLLGLEAESVRVAQLAYPFEKYTRLMNRLEAEHSAPNGGLFLVLQDDAPVGCGMYHRLCPNTAEIKRVYIAPDGRGLGAGRALMQRLIGDIRDQGYARILMDTGKVLTTATALYLSLGFRLRGPYQDVPPEAEGLLRFFEMGLG